MGPPPAAPGGGGGSDRVRRGAPDAPVMAQRRSARSAASALAAWVAGFLTVWASSATTRSQCTRVAPFLAPTSAASVA